MKARTVWARARVCVCSRTCALSSVFIASSLPCFVSSSCPCSARIRSSYSRTSSSLGPRVADAWTAERQPMRACVRDCLLLVACCLLLVFVSLTLSHTHTLTNTQTHTDTNTRTNTNTNKNTPSASLCVGGIALCKVVRPELPAVCPRVETFAPSAAR